MKIDLKTLHFILVRPGYVSQEAMEKAVSRAGPEVERVVGELLDRELIKDEQLGRLMAQYFGWRFINLRQEKIDEKVLRQLPEAAASGLGVVPFACRKNLVLAGMTAPDDLDAIHILEKAYHCPVEPYYITRRDQAEAMERYQSGLKGGIEKKLEYFKDKGGKGAGEDEFIVGLVKDIFDYGFYNKASDIHLEPMEGRALVRYRIDGVMHPMFEIPPELAERIIMRVKILSKIRIDEHQAAQDGRFRFRAGGNNVDVRVSIVPLNKGEKAVLRLLTTEGRDIGINNLGLSENDLKRVKEAAKHPHGMILATGPTGSGKTTTLYAVLRLVNKPEINIASIEDPIEYNIEGVSQIQVNPKTGLTFAKGLRAIVRQDPDIIMVGEVRDEETAEIAVNSAMTGHLVLSTLHANDAVTALPRLLDMKIKPFLLTSTVKIIIAQRLVRRTCPKCLYSYKAAKSEQDIIKAHPRLKSIFSALGKEDVSGLRFYRSKGCQSCAHTGYKGRVGIFEILEVKGRIKELILKHADSNEIEQAAGKSGPAGLLRDGIDKVLKGETTFSEVLRVTELGEQNDASTPRRPE